MGSITPPTASLPTRQTAVVAQGPGAVAVVRNAPMPALAPDTALIRVAAVALNPVDAKMLDYHATAGAVHGDDFAGTVVALGAAAQRAGRVRVGDRVAGFVHGMHRHRPSRGAFAQYVDCPAELLLRLPAAMRFEEAATLGLGVATAAMALFRELRVPGGLEALERAAKGGAPVERDDQLPRGAFVLVVGGSTATGTRAIQLAKLAGLRPITTCSPAHFGLAKRFGAEAAFDYHSASVAAEIRAYTRNELALALDCVSLADTTTLCYGALGRAGGRYVALEPVRDAVAQTRAETVAAGWLLSLTVFGDPVEIEEVYSREKDAGARAFGARAYAAVQGLLDRGLLVAHPSKVMSGGLEGVVKGVDVMRRSPPSGYKMVYTVA